MAVKENNEPKIEQILLDLLANTLFGAGRKIESDTLKWSLVWREAYVQAVTLIAFSGASPENCDEKFISLIRNKLQNDLRAVMHVNKEHIRLHKIMTDAGIPYVILKGAASAAYYPDPLMRVMGDVDFLVDSADVEKACNALEEKGFKRNPKEHEKHIVYFDENGNYEMHITPAGVPKGADGDKVRDLLKDIIADSREYETDFGIIRVPSDFHHGLVILLHTCSHLTSEGIGLRQLCDWATFVSHFSDENFCEIFEEKLKSVGLWKFAQVLTQVSVKCFDCPGHSWTGAEDVVLIDGVIRDIFKNGNLGQKNPTGMQESLLITGNGKKESFIKQIFSSMNEIVYFYWNFTRKFKILLPFGWLYFGGRYVIRSLMGKRPKIDIKNIKARANTRTDLYDELDLFKN
ncbi:MAG: nucleotidyltransferase family protein [Clostridia bacterium]|nr:nucleotidyltransferase family protein [Clostridia bacterium]